MSRADHIEEIDFIARSPNRVSLLSLLHTHQQIEKDELKDRCAAVRTTLQRNLDALEERGWITQTSTSEYRITPSGEMIAEAFVHLVDIVEIADDLSEFFRWIPPESFDIDPRTLAAAQVTVSDPHNPYVTVSKHLKALESTRTFKALLPVVGREALEVRWRQHQKDEALDEVVVSSGAAEILRSDSSYAKMLKEILESGRAQIFVYQGQIPYFVGIYDDLVHIGVEDPEGMPRAMIGTDSEEVREWAEQKYEQYRDQSELFDI